MDLQERTTNLINDLRAHVETAKKVRQKQGDWTSEVEMGLLKSVVVIISSMHARIQALEEKND